MRYTFSTDNGNGQPVKGAVITFSRNGAVFNAVDFPDNTGILYFDSVADSDLFQSDVSVRVEAPGSNPAGTTGSSITGDWVFVLRSNGLEKAALVGVGIAAGLFLLSANAGKRKGKKIAGIDVKKDVLPWLPVVAIGVGGYLLYNGFFGKSDEEKAREAALDAAIDNSGPGVLSDAQVTTMADALHNDLGYSSVSNNPADAVRLLTSITTTSDVLRLIKLYGKRWITFFGIPRGTFTLNEAIADQMAQSDIQTINDYYAGRGINYQF